MIRSAYAVTGALVATILVTPLTASAATFKQIVEGQIFDLGNLLTQLLYLIAFFVFLFGVFKYFFGSGANAEENRQKGRQLMFWGIISLVVLFAVWGIVRIFLGILESWA